MVPWILRCLHVLALSLYPTTPEPPLDETARAIDVAAHQVPLDGDDGVVEMARELAVLAATEGHLRPDAVARDRFGESYGLFQLHETTLRWLRRPKEDAFDPVTAALIAAVLIRKSHAVCAKAGKGAELGWYASGGPTCSVPEGLAASARRMRLAASLPSPVWVSPR